jgi:hypothetical protein
VEPGDDTEVSAATPDRPEQVGVVVRVDRADAAVCGDQFGGQHVVDRQSVATRQEADAAAEGRPADPRAAGVAETDGQLVVAELSGQRSGGEPAARPRGAL